MPESNGAAGNGAAQNGSSAAKDWGMATRLAHPTSAGTEDPYASMAPPMYQTATFKQPSATENGPYDYTRSGNPTRDILEQNLAELEGGCSGLAFTSGMAAINAACKLVKAGACCDAYMLACWGVCCRRVSASTV